MEFSPDQLNALKTLGDSGNTFLTGRAGTGKSTLLREFLKTADPDTTVVLASTGAAAVLVNGRTFHSFFGLGILEGGPEKTQERALKNPLLRKRIKAARTVVIDEISMIPGETLATAEAIARKARGNDEPWGNLRIIAVGDFAQLPPVTINRAEVDWAFLHPVWTTSNFTPVVLETVHRSLSNEWTEVLNLIREGVCDSHVQEFLNSCMRPPADDETATRLFARRDEAERFNLHKLSELPGETTVLPTEFIGTPNAVEQLRRNCPIPEELAVKPGALVMIRKNETNGLYVNGSLAILEEILKSSLRVTLLDTGMKVDLEKMKFELLDAEGEIVAAARNYPINLAYGSTIHKSQGATMDAMRVRLVNLWESGHAYVALSRVRSHKNLFLDGWNAKSIRLDEAVRNFHRQIGSA